MNKFILYFFLSFSLIIVFSDTAHTQTPTLTNETPAEGFIGEQICFPITFVNAGTPGYGPYVRLVLPPEITFDNASFAGAAQTIQNLGTIVATAPNNFVIDPIATSNANTTTNDTIFAPVGSTVILLEYPVGSMVTGGVSLITELCVTVDAAAPIGIPVDICVQGMYEFGDTPTGDNGPIAAAAVCEPIIPILFRFDKKVDGSDGIFDEVPGAGPVPCHPHQYQLNIDIAAAGTLTGPITIEDELPGELSYLGNLSIPTGCVIDAQPIIGGMGGTLTITCNGSFNGSVSNIDMQVTFDAAVSDTLDETICDFDDIENAAFTTVPGNPTQRDTVGTHVEHVNLGHGNNAGGPVAIGTTVGYTIDFDITEYTTGVSAAVITFVVANGMLYDPNSLTWNGVAVPLANQTIAAGPGNGSTITVDVHAEGGGINIPPCGSPSLQYNADVRETYGNGDPVLSRDRLNHTSTITYNLAEGASGCTDGAGTPIDIVDISFQKTVLNSPPTGPGRNGQWWPGDIVTYQLELRVPSLDLDDVVITDFFPLPIHDVSDLAPAFGTDVVFGASNCWPNNPINYTRDIPTNSLILDFGDLSNSVTGGCIDIVLEISIPITTIPFADGLFHSNFMQINSDNSSSDDETNNVLTLIQVAAPELALTKGIVSSSNAGVTISPVVSPPNGNATGANAGDQLTFNINVTNNGGSPGHDVQIRDVAPPELTNCMLTAPTPVTDGTGTAIPFTGNFAGNSLTIDITPAINFTGAAGGADIINVSYTCDVVSGIESGTEFDNTAEVDWASAPGQVKFPPVDDMASVTTANPTMNKTIDYIYPNYSGNNSQASIGEVVAYELQMNIPEGSMNNVSLVDRLDAGLAFVGVDSIIICSSSGAANITTSIGGGFAAVRSGAAISNTGAGTVNQDRELTLDFGNLQNSDIDNINDTIKVYYRTIVTNDVINVDGVQRNNRADVIWDDPNTPGSTLNVVTNAPNVTIVEPELQITKSFTPDEVLPGNNSFVTITVRNLPTSSAPAFDVNLTDILPTGMLFVSGFSEGGTASITTPANHAGGTITAHLDTINVGEIYSITFEVGVSSAITPCFTLNNCANITWESIAQADEPSMPSAFSSPLGIKRSGNPGAPGGAANTYTQDSCAELDVVIDNTFDPFITANTPLCEGSRAVLSVQQYNGNVVTYNWTGPGVPAGFNNYELVIDPVTSADTGTYFVYVELDGCTTDTSNSFVLQLRPQPGAPNITPNDTTVCEGASIQFSTDSLATVYNWTGPNGFTANSATTPLIIPVDLADAGTYTLVTTNSQGCSSTPATVDLTVTPRPVQPSIANNTPVCSGEDLVLSSSTTATTYRWIAPNGQDTTTTVSTLNLSASSNLYLFGNWTLATTDASGCESEPSLSSAVVINSTPNPPVTSNSGPICEGQAIVLTVNSVSGATYSWYSDENLTNLVASSQNPTISGLLAANSPDTFFVQINSNGCLSDTGFTEVLINSNPAAFTPNYTSILCSGDTLLLFANTVASSYSWAGPNGFVSNIENPFIANSAAINAGTYSVSITDANGCANSGLVQVAVDERPATPNITSNGTICEGQDIILTVSGYTGTSVQYMWNTPTGAVTTTVPNLTINNTTTADSGTYGLVVMVDGCTSLADSINIEVNANPIAPNVPADFAVCENGAIALTTNTVANVYMWTGPNGFNSNSPNPPTISPASSVHAGTYNLVVTDFNGCTSPSSSVVVTVNPAPTTPALTTNSAICAGEDLILSTTATTTNYIWIAPNGADTTTTTADATIPSSSLLYQAGNWTLVVEDANTCRSAPSVASNVTINTIPASASPSNNGPVCNNSNAQLSAGTIAGASYSWSTDMAGSNVFSTLQNPMVNLLNNDSTVYLIVTVNGCATTVESTTVTVIPQAAAPNVPADFDVCERESITLTSSTIANGYLWTGPNGFNSTQQNPAVISNANSNNAGTYTLVVTNANGCESTPASVVVTVNPAPTTPALTTNSAICAGEDLILSTTATATSYMWIAPNGADTTTTTADATIPSSSLLYQAGNWTLVVEDANTCQSQPSVASNVTINTIPASASPSNNGPVCNNSNAQLSAGTIAGASYSWSTDMAGSNVFSTLQNPMVNLLNNDSTFYLIVTVNGCATTVESTTVTVIPQAAAPNVPADFDVCERESITLTSSTIANGYLWTGPNGFNSTQQNPAVISNANSNNAGTYTLVVTDANGCESTPASVVVTVNSAPTRPALTTNSAICAGEDLILSTTATATSYMWIAPNGADTTTTTADATIPSSSLLYQAGNWTLVVEDANTCQSAPSVASNVTINTIPASASPSNNGPVCNNSNAQLSAGTIAGASYSWSTDMAGSNVFSTLQNPMVNLLNNDSTFYLIVTVNGCATTVESTTVTVIPQAAAPNVPADFDVCERESITLTSSTIANGYLWTGPNGFNSTQQNPAVISNANSNNAGTYTLVVTDANGCESTPASVVVTVNSAPTRPALTTNSAICAGEDLILSTTATATSYMWIAPNGTDTTTTTADATILSSSLLYQAGNWTLVIEDANTCQSQPSVASNVVINSTITPVAFNNGSVCNGDAVMLSTTTIGSALYEWYSDATLTNLISTQQNPIVNNIISDSTFFLVVTVNGCRSTAVSTTVTLHPTPATPAVPADFEVCEGEDITLTTSTNASLYNWTGPNGFSSMQQNPTVISPSTTADAGIYTLFITDANGCESADTTTVVTVNIAPAAPVLTNNSAICTGDTLILSTTASADTFRWTAPNGLDTFTLVNNLMIIPTNTTFYQSGDWTLITQVGNNCPSLMSSPSSVVINSATTAPIAYNNGPVCVGGTVTLSTPSAPGAFYQWYTDATLTNLIATTATVTVPNINTDSTFYLVVTVSGCTSPAGNTMVTVINQLAPADVPADFAICEGGDIILTTSTNASAYSWTGPNGFTSNQQNPTVISNATYIDSGDYHLVVTFANGCVSRDTIVHVSVNPNPAQPILTSNSSICVGEDLVLSTTSMATSYTWIAPNGADTVTTTADATIPSSSSLYQAGDWTLVLTDGNSCSSIPSAAETVEINAIPATPIINNSGPVCMGENAQFTTANVANATYAWFSDVALTTLVSTQQNPMLTNLTTDTTWYLVVTVNGCSSVAGNSTILVHPVPATPSVPADFEVCEGESISLSSSTTASGYNWTGPNGFTSNLQNPTVINNATFADSGIYTLSIIDGNGCQSMDTTVQVTVNPNPAQPILTSNSSICEGDDLVLSTTATATTYTWIAPNGADTVTTTANATIPSSSSLYQAGDWTLVLTDGNSCSSIPSAAETVEINAIPATPIINNSGPVCMGENAQFTTANVANATYAWFSDVALTTLVSTQQNPMLTNLTTDTTWYLVVTVDGCSSVAGNSTILVHPVPATPSVPADFEVCEGQSISLSSSTTASGYNWTGPNGFNSNLQNPTVINNATFADSGIYTLSIIDGNGCQSMDTTVQVTVNPNPAQPILTSNSSICVGEDLVLSTTSMATSYTWIAPNGADTVTTTANATIPSSSSLYQAGDWTLVLTDGNSCSSISSAAETVEINAIPATPIINNSGPVCMGENAQFNIATVANATYAWFSDAALTTLVSTQQNPMLTNLTTDTTWYLVVTVDGCSSVAGNSTILVHPVPATPSVPADFEVCEGNNITLETSTVANAYFWTGPNGFNSTQRFPLVIQQATVSDSGDYSLSIIDGNGCQSMDTTVHVTVNPNPANPIITYNGPLCFGDTLTIASSGDCVQSQWIGPNGNSTSTLGTPGGNNVLWTFGTTTNIPSTDVNYLSGAWHMICIDTMTGCRSESNTINVEINAVPVVSAFNNGPICAGENGELSATFIAGANYAWYSDAALTTLVSTSRTPILSNMMASATYYVQATVNGCTSLTDSTMIIVNPAPVVPAPSYTPLCQLDTLFLFANATGPIATYGWTGPNGFNSHLENPVIPNIYPFNAGSYVLTVVDSFGCEAASTVEVTIYPKPQTPTITHNAPFCENTADLTLYTQAYFGTDVRYFWTLPNGTMDTTLVPSLIVPNAMVTDTGLYSLVVFVDGCLSLPAEEDIMIYPTPATPNIFADSAVCEGNDIVLTTTTTATGYFWTGPNGFQSNLPSPTVVAATAVDSGTYSLYVTNTWGCQSADTSVHITVNANPPAPVITSNAPLCFGDTLTITSSGDCVQSQWIGPNGNSAGTLGTVGANNVLWTFGSTTNIPSTDANYLSGDWYMVCIDTLTGCSTESNTINIDITPIPDTPAVFNNSPICVGESVELTTATITGATYAWYADSTMTTLVATSQNPTITNITTDSTFYLAIRVNGCTSELGNTTVIVHPIPATPAIPADFEVCVGDNIVLSTTTTAAGYFWTGPNGFNSGLQNPSVVNSTVIDSGAYTLYIIDANGCRSGDTTVNVVVNPNPAQPVLTSNSAICDGDDLVLSTTATATNYRWIAPNGADTITTTDTLVIGTTDPFYQDGAWTLIVIDGNSCESVVSNTEQVIIHSIPPAQAVFNSGPVCNGDEVNLFTSFINGATYEWYADAAMTTLIATSQNPTISNIITDSTFYLFITVNGCTSPAGSTTVQVHPTPAAPNVPANITVCEGEAVVLTTTTNAASYFWTGPNGFNSNQQNPTAIANATVLDSGTYNLFIIDANGCRSGDTSVPVIVNPTPVQPFIATNNTPICEGDDVVLTANTATGATYEWFNSAGTSVGVGQILTITAATTVDAGDYYVVTTLNGCNSAASDVATVLIDAIPTTMPFAGNDINLCDEFNTVLAATPANGATGTWTTSSGATIVNPTVYNTAVYNLPTGSSTFYWTLSNGACFDYAVDSMVVDVTPASGELADAGLDQNICGQTMATLAAATPTISTGIWTQSSTQAGQGVVITNPTNPNSTVTGLQQGNSYIFIWTLSNGNCTDHSSDQVTIDMDVAPPDVAYAGQDIALCNNNTATLAAFSSQYGTGLWTTASGATIIDPTNPNTPVVNLTANDTSVFYWTLSNGTCMDYSTDSVLVAVSTANDVADAGVNQVVCGQSSLNLAATAPTFGIGTWTQTSGQAAQGINILDPNDPATLITGLQQGNTYTFTWTLSNGTCVDYDSDNTIVTITTSPPDNAYAGADINLCGNNSTTLAAAVPSVANGTWTTTSTAVITNPTLPNSTVANLPIGTSVFVWTLSSGSCIDYDDDTLVITVTQPSGDIADAGLDTAYCAQNAINLQGTAPSVGLGFWTQTPAQAGLGAVINDVNDPNTLVTGLLAGRVYEFTWTLTNGGCVDYSSDKVLITIDIFPNDVAYAGEDTVLCGGDALHLDGTAPPIGTGLWTTNAPATIVDPSIASSEVVFILQDTTTYYWTLTNGACVDYSVDSVQVVLAPVSSDIATAGFDQTLCGVDSIVLNGSVPTTSTGLWTQSNNQASQGIVITDPTDPTSSVTGLQVGNTYYFEWTLSTTGCPNFSSDDVNYTINALPTEVAYAGPDIILCDDNKTNMAANVPVSSTGVWSTNSSSIVINPTLPNTSVVNLNSDTTELYWTLSNGSCVDYSVDTMIVLAAPTTIDPADAGLDLAICNDSVGVITAVSPTIATGIWTQTAAQASLGVSIANPTSASTAIAGLMPDNEYRFTWTLSSGPCIDYDSDDAIVVVSRLPRDNAYGGENMVICGINNTIIAATPPTIGTGEWTTTTGAVIVNPTEATTEVLDLNLGANVFIWSISNGACVDYSIDTLLVTIDNAPIANNDSIAVLYNSTIAPISVITNDSLNSSWRIDLVTPPSKGTATNLNDGSFEILTADILATQQFTYRLCNPACPDRFCDTAKVTIKIQGGFDCKVPNVITPNKDEINDVLFIPCLENYPDTKLLVFNRWGDQVYSSDNYQNDWDGTYNSKPSPDGTYYYIMILPTGDELQGFVEVRR